MNRPERRTAEMKPFTLCARMAADQCGRGFAASVGEGENRSINVAAGVSCRDRVALFRRCAGAGTLNRRHVAIFIGIPAAQAAPKDECRSVYRSIEAGIG
jgi:hypothetical protein